MFILKDDGRRYVDLTTFGFFKGGILDVEMVNLRLPSGPVQGEVSVFSLFWILLVLM